MSGSDQKLSGDKQGSTELVAGSVLESGKIVDYISGQVVEAGPEELDATQPFSRLLVEDYGYPKGNIQTRPQFRVKASPSDQARTVPVDIAVFDSTDHSPDQLYMIVECKASHEKSEETDDKQIFNYLNWSQARIGVWTNGEEREIYLKVPHGGKFKYEKIPSLPRYGENPQEIGQYLRKELRAPQNLQQVFRTIRAHLAGNARGTTRDEAIARQMINLIFCKIYDERFTAPDELVTFRAGIDDTDETVMTRIKDVFSQVKSKYDEVFDESDVLTLDAASVKYVVGELQNFCLTDAGRDAVGEAFEVFIGGTLKGDQGQFFTPRNVIQLMTFIASPGVRDQVIDPACGAGGFIIEALRQKWQKVDALGEKNHWSPDAISEEKVATAIKTIKGIDKDDFLVKVAKAYMAILGDGKGSIYSEDSLDLPSSWRQAGSDVHLGSFDLVLANPPFGKDIKVRGGNKLKQYSLAHVWTKRKGQPPTRTEKIQKEMNPQILFVERCLQLAKPCGTIGLILPETYFHSPSNSNVREVLLRQNNVKALIDLPHNTFRPFNNAKCIAVILEKGVVQQDKILGVVAEEMGHNHQGKPIYRRPGDGSDKAQIWDDITAAYEALRDQCESDLVFEIDAAEVKANDIWVPRYYWPKLNQDFDAPGNYEIQWTSLGEFIDRGIIEDSSGHGSPASTEKGQGRYTYARVKDIVNWEIYRDPTSGITQAMMRELTEKNPLKELDIAYVSRGSYRIGDVAMVGPSDVETALTREIRRFRVNPAHFDELDPYYLLYLLSTEAVHLQTEAKVLLDTTLPNIGNRYLTLELPWAVDPDVRKEISDQVRQALNAKWKAAENIRELLSSIDSN
ncbi:N-6 DNA methylase [Corynebacterium sp. CCUG 61414]|uniref:restriction endonuclease subunit M n=1 Tax=Corynebacterium sp. CCUG 61414 TaxID=2823896 RepID=UPI00210C1D0A|nr:N-6 DNA methylase [Corynebacterium sp. CCUG 61414]MCQ4609954.1 N-6 DNA methylase [Corynebacterium sp. CCUG 61414]